MYLRKHRDGTLVQCPFGISSFSQLAISAEGHSVVSPAAKSTKFAITPTRVPRRRLPFSVSQEQKTSITLAFRRPPLPAANSSSNCHDGACETWFNFRGARVSPGCFPDSAQLGKRLTSIGLAGGKGKSSPMLQEQPYPLAQVLMIEAEVPQVRGRLAGMLDRMLIRRTRFRRGARLAANLPAVPDRSLLVLRGVPKEIDSVSPKKVRNPAAAAPVPVSNKDVALPPGRESHSRPLKVSSLPQKPKARPRADSPVKKLELKQVSAITPYEEHPINSLFREINKFTGMLRGKDQSPADIKSVKQMYTRLCGRKAKFVAEDLRSREMINEIKETMLRLVLETLSRENAMVPQPKEKKPEQAKCFVGLGNNPGLVKAVMKERWWWSVTTEEEEASVLWTQWRKMSFIRRLEKMKGPGQKKNPQESEGDEEIPCGLRLCNHLEGNYCMGNKKGLYYCMKKYCAVRKIDLADILPLTFHIRKGRADPEFDKFVKTFASLATDRGSEESPQGNVWIVKPGENTNRGTGIMVSQDLREIESLVADPAHTYIVQKYIERPLLYKKRKFDLRCYGLMTSVNGLIKGYFYPEGYVRTSSRPFTLDDLSRDVHLTNEAVQINYEDFGKFEAGNKVSYSDLQEYLAAKRGVDFLKDIVPKIKVPNRTIW